MSGTASGAVAVGEPAGRRRIHPRRLIVGAAVVALLAVAADVLGWDVRDWFSQLWDTLTGISFGWLVAGAVLQTAQTVLKATAWHGILVYAYPEARVSWVQVLACYSASLALNSFLPANMGTLAMMLMFVAIIPGANFVGITAAYLVQKIFFTISGALVYLYLFASVSGSFDIKFERVHAHPWVTAFIILGAIAGVAVVVRILWRWVKKLWADAKQGGRVLRYPGAYVGRVLVPQTLGWCAGLGVVAVFLAAYGIPVTFHTVMSVVGGNSLANVTAVTPGSVGVTQAFNVASLNSVTSAETATAYSVGQQLFTTAWNIMFGVVMLVWAFGWTGGRALLDQSYAGAKEKAAEQAEARRARREAAPADEPRRGLRRRLRDGDDSDA